MIKVLHIGHSRKWRGGENQVRLLIQGMQAQQFDVEHYIAYPGGAQMIERIGAQVAAVLKLPSTQPIDPRSVRAVVRFCRQHKIDILDAHSGSAHSLAFYAKFYLPDVTVVVHRRVNFKVKKTYFTRRKYLSDKIDHYVAISAAIRENLIGYDVPAEKISLIKSAVDSSPYQGLSKKASKSSWCQRYGWDSHTPLLGFAAALDPSKDPMLFVQIVKELRQRGCDVNALIAGRGKLEKDLQSEIDRLSLNEHVKLTGFVEQMPELFSAFDIFYLPSRQEGLGTVLLEAIFSECAIIASNVGGIGEIVQHQRTGLLANSGDIIGFADASEELLESESMRDQLKANALAHANQSFSISNLLDNNLNVYQKLLG